MKPSVKKIPILYKGVKMRKWGRWVAEVRRQNGRNRIWLGTYNNENEAARAYDAAIFCLHGPSCLESLNFPDDPPRNISNNPNTFSNSQIQMAAANHAYKDGEDAVVPVRVVGEEDVSKVDVILRIGRGA
ncbi:ethylene-responsive transcription factor ERF017-like [Impatiens glandulifera]|uniref:ethylene-responsive transcription factor ERF017-like n=1 Tax=Impatiens glandulifera TaxID=253017 RepID=UPI001FB18639|nr:ethylene-responsive transcription factor ERF017-like [Impatiens glandulifera]